MDDKESLITKTDFILILVTGIFNISVGLLLLYMGVFLIPDQWYKLIHILLSFLILSYPFIHYRDLMKLNHTHN